MTPTELRDAVRRLSDRDLILIDTAGRGQRDAVKIRELKQFFTAVKPSEIHLVLSGAARQSVLNEAIERFREVGVDRVIFTKLDEAVGFGVILNCLNKAGAELSYVTTGQDVPDDILIAESRQLAGRILENAPKPPNSGNGFSAVQRNHERVSDPAQSADFAFGSQST
jgi:flagellar biosynthesis protein FlhF